MSFRDDHQIARVCRVLCAPIRGKGELWTTHGPTLIACGATKGWSSGERLLLQISLDLWNGHGRASLDKILKTLDESNLGRLGALLVAIAEGPPAIDKWIARHRLVDADEVA